MKRLHQAQKDTLGKHDQMIEKQDVMIGKQDQTISIIKSGVDEMRESREENKTILHDYGVHRKVLEEKGEVFK